MSLRMRHFASWLRVTVALPLHAFQRGQSERTMRHVPATGAVMLPAPALLVRCYDVASRGAAGMLSCGDMSANPQQGCLCFFLSIESKAPYVLIGGSLVQPQDVSEHLTTVYMKKCDRGKKCLFEGSTPLAATPAAG